VFSALGNLTELPPEAINQSAAKSSNQAFASNMSATISDFERDLADEKDTEQQSPRSGSGGGLSAAIEKINQLNKRSSTLTKKKTAPPPAPVKPPPRPAPTREAAKPAASSSAPYNRPAAAAKPSPAARAPAARTDSSKMPAVKPRAVSSAQQGKPAVKKRPAPAAARTRARSPQNLDVEAALSAIDSLDITSERPQRRVMEEIVIQSPEAAAAQAQAADRRVKALARPQPSSPNLPAVARPASVIPKALMEDFQRAKAAAIMAKQSAKGNIWVIGSVFLMFVFLSQTIYFKYNDLARISSLRPWMEKFCHVANCEISLPFEMKKLELIGQDIRSHPKVRKALLVTVTLMNRAKYPQAYPGLEIKFRDMNSQMVAMRRFLPADYLGPKTNIEAGIPANTPIEVELQLIDPGSSAINFEFDMFRAS